jgi:hypothetical protein
MMMVMMMVTVIQKDGKCLPIDAALNTPPSLSLESPVMFSESYATVISSLCFYSLCKDSACVFSFGILFVRLALVFFFFCSLCLL